VTQESLRQPGAVRQPETARRAVLASVGLAGVAVLAGCSGGGTPSASSGAMSGGSGMASGSAGSSGGAGGLTAALGSTPAAGSGSGGSTSGGSSSDGSTSSGSTSSGSTSSGSTSGGSTSSGAGGTVLGTASEIPVGGGKIFTANKVVVTQPSAGEYKAFSAVCTHMQCLVDKVSNGTIQCPCHGSQFSITNGSVVAGPAPSPLPVQPITVSGGTISAT
jgi:Rieske Fe-S protein